MQTKTIKGLLGEDGEKRDLVVFAAECKQTGALRGLRALEPRWFRAASRCALAVALLKDFDQLMEQFNASVSPPGAQ